MHAQRPYMVLLQTAKNIIETQVDMAIITDPVFMGAVKLSYGYTLTRMFNWNAFFVPV